jgi:long-chain acyl-CoA synthetase
MNLVTFLKQQVKRYRQKVLLCSAESQIISYQNFDDITDRMAYGLRRLGVCSGDRVAVLHPNHVETLLAYYAIIKAGGIVVPVNSAYTAFEMKFIFNNSGAKIVMAADTFSPAINKIKPELQKVEHIILRREAETFERVIENAAGAPLQAVEQLTIEPDDTAFLIYTSGTTGNPKGVILSHRNFCFVGPNMAQTYGLLENDITIAILPLCHIFSIASPFFGSLSSGGSVVVAERFNPQSILEIVEKYKVTWFPGVPTMFIYLLNYLDANRCDLSSLRMGLSGGASLPVEILEKWENVTNARIIEVYGLTESTGLVTANPIYGVRKPGSIGINAAGITAKIVDAAGTEVPVGAVGELVFKGPNATKGYFGLPQETREKIKDGWMHTGDHAYRDEDGYFYIVGRAKELIISGGYNIYPREIEEILHSHKAVQEVAVIGIPDLHKGEVPKAYVVLKNSIVAKEEDLIEYCAQSLARYKIPKIQFMKELPKNQTGKIMKKELPKE